MLQRKRNETNFGLVLFIYWFALVLWQSISSSAILSTPDIIIKFVLIVFLTVCFLRAGLRDLSPGGLFVCFLLALSMAFSAVNDTLSGLRDVISYAFPVLAVFLFFTIGNKNRISMEQYDKYLKLIIGAALYMGLYAVLFRSSQITAALTASGAYGNQLTSFFVSNHEYGMYLVFAASAAMYLFFKNPQRKALYLLLIAFFLFNLVLTFSRTSLVAFACFLLMFILFSKSRKLILFTLIGILLVIVLWSVVPSLADFFNGVVFRTDVDAERFSIWEETTRIFNDAGFSEKLFGHGYNITSQLLSDTVGHASHTMRFCRC